MPLTSRRGKGCQCLLTTLFIATFVPARAQQPVAELDLLAPPSPATYSRALGLLGTGSFGVPVCGGHDCDGDGFADFAFSSMTANPLGLGVSGMVTLVFGNGTFGETISASSNRTLFIVGISLNELAGSEIWMDDVTGDGLGDLLIGRQNLSPDPFRRGAGALSIVAGGAHLRQIDGGQLRLNADAEYPIVHILGAEAYDRLGIWMRTGDVDGDGIADLAVGADEADGPNQRNRGEVYLIQGGDHLSTSKIIDLADFPETKLDARLARIVPPPVGHDYHFGATLHLGDLNGNGRAELLIGATIDRVGAGIRLPNAPAGTGQSNSGPPGGEAYILWDDHFRADLWVEGYDLELTGVDPDTTIMRGGARNAKFGEELVPIPDLDGDRKADLFVGDLSANTVNGTRSGIGYLFFDAERLRGRSFSMSNPPALLDITTILGRAPGALSGDTAAAGDFDGDGLSDIAIGNPHDSPKNRITAGSLSVLYGRQGPWPEVIDLVSSRLPPQAILTSSLVVGARGTLNDLGDTLGYSMAAADLDGDLRSEIIVNEMLGNGAAVDTGNLLVINGGAVLAFDAPVAPSLISLTFALDGSINFQFRSRVGQGYRLEQSEDLIEWITVAGPIDGVPGESELTAPADGESRQFYYRIASEFP